MFSKNDRFTLIATALLGILLYAVMQFGNDLEQAATVEEALGLEGATVDSPVPAPPKSAPAPDPRLPRITSHEELVAFLDARGLDGRLLTDEAANWYRARGFLGAYELFGVTADRAPGVYYETLDEPTLQAMSDAGDAGATQTLARLAMFLDPILGYALYKKAVTQGSVYAVIRVADTLNLFAETQLIDYASDQALFEKYLNMQKRVPGGNLHTEAYATLLAALGDGGPPIVDAELLAWSGRLEAKAPQQSLEYGCRRSGEILVENSAARRSNSLAPLSITPPPVFMGMTDREERMPCAAGSYPIISMMDVSDCAVERVVNDAGAEADLHICRP